MWEVQTTKVFGGKKYRLDHWYKTKDEAQQHAMSLRRRNFLARVLPAPKNPVGLQWRRARQRDLEDGRRGRKLDPPGG